MLRTIELTRTERDQLLERSDAFVAFRMRCVAYLRRHGRLRDKFTISKRDHQKRRAGYIVEEVLRSSLPRLYPGCVQRVERWSARFDLKRIMRIVETGTGGEEEIGLVARYFYDEWDLELTTAAGKTCCCDVKTAMTARSPGLDWDYLYPVVQVSAEKKDLVLLAFFVCEKNARKKPRVGPDGETVIDPELLSHIVLAGATTAATIQACKVLAPGERTSPRETLSRVANYWTVLGRDYRDLASLCPE